MKISDILSKKSVAGVETVGERETLSSLVRLLADRRIGAAMVTGAKGGVVGVISERDVVRALAESGDRALNDPVDRHMTREVQKATPGDGVISVLSRMTEGRFRHMPVMQGGHLVGVVSIGDLVKARIDALQAENAALEEFIRS